MLATVRLGLAVFSVSSLAVVPLPQARQAPSAEMVVSAAWLAERLQDPRVVVIAATSDEDYTRGHIPGARALDHSHTIGQDHHRLLDSATLAAVLSRAGARDDARMVLYGDSAMETGWLYMILASLGHGDRVSILDGGFEGWRSAGRPVTTAVPPPPAGRLTPRPSSDVIVDRQYVRERLEDRATRILDVRTTGERANGFIPGSSLIFWQELFADPKQLTFKSRDEIRAVLARAGLKSDQQAITYCAVGMRASLMYFALRHVGAQARVYVGSLENWRRQTLSN